MLASTISTRGAATLAELKVKKQKAEKAREIVSGIAKISLAEMVQCIALGRDGAEHLESLGDILCDIEKAMRSLRDMSFQGR